jgi:hypothetical protein
MKRFVTLNLTTPMEPDPNGQNVPKPHMIFRAKKMQVVMNGLACTMER